MNSIPFKINPNIEGIEVSPETARMLEWENGSQLFFSEHNSPTWLVSPYSDNLKTNEITKEFMKKYDTALRKLAE